jgi:hypothetical protein
MSRTYLVPHLVAAVAVSLLMAACSADRSDPAGVSVANTGTPAPTIEPVTDTVLALPDGLFELAGYGTVLHVDGDDVTPFYVTSSTCVPGETFDNELPVDHAGGDGTITIDLVGPTTDYRLRPLQGDLACESDASDTLLAVDELFTTHYPFFERRDFDWPDAFADIEAATNADPGAFEEAFARALVDLGDGHTTLDDLDIDPDVDAFGLDNVSTLEQLEPVIGEEFDRSLASIDDITADGTGSVAWGRVNDDVGYLIMVAFESISGDDGDPVADREALRTALDEAIAELAEVDRLVVDMRFNVGGYEDLAVLAAGYFVDEPTPAYRKWAHAQPDPVAQVVEIRPQDAFFGGRVAVVTSPITASAAEAFTLAMVEVADADLIGSPSFGEFSDAIDWVLPNGTEFTISMENYTDLAGTNHEATGLPVDVSAPFDEAIEVAAEHLAGNRSSN